MGSQSSHLKDFNSKDLYSGEYSIIGSHNENLYTTQTQNLYNVDSSSPGTFHESFSEEPLYEKTSTTPSPLFPEKLTVDIEQEYPYSKNPYDNMTMPYEEMPLEDISSLARTISPQDTHSVAEGTSEVSTGKPGTKMCFCPCEPDQ